MKFSIIIPTIGRDTLEAVLDVLFLSKKSVQSEVEIIVIFDDARDACQVVRQKNQESLVCLETTKKVYAGGARNLGIEQARGDVLIFIGDDTIPQSDWLEKTIAWHLAHPAVSEALLGRVAWIEPLAGDRFHRWMDKNAQFDYGRLNRGFLPSWHHFYTSNVSVKSQLVEDKRFHEAFRGWGFEDAEFGYQLHQAGMQLHYEASIEVQHDDPQSVESLIKRTKAAHKNALVFELLHPEVNILPRHGKRALLQLIIWFLWPWRFIPEVAWWRTWKQSWIS